MVDDDILSHVVFITRPQLCDQLREEDKMRSELVKKEEEIHTFQVDDMIDDGRL